MNKTNKVSQQKTKTPKKHTVIRLFKYVWSISKSSLILTFILFLFNGISNITSPVFIKLFVDDIVIPGLSNNAGMTNEIMQQLTSYTIAMSMILVIGLVSGYLGQFILNKLAQNLMHKLRQDMFNHMESLPISYFDTNHHGDIMSRYTNDADTLRQLVVGAYSQFVVSFFQICACLILMMLYSFALMAIVLVFAGIMIAFGRLTSVVSAKAFMKQQEVIGEVEGYVEEMMTGQKVIKVFNHEKQVQEGFDKLNEAYYKLNVRGNRFGNVLFPIIGNIGYILFIVVTIVGAILYAFTPENTNLTILGFNTLSIGTIVSFLSLCRQFSNNIAMSSSQVTVLVMGLAGANRVFEFLDEKSEVDDGVVTLVNCKIDEDGQIVEVPERTGMWAWKQPANDKYPLTYRLLRGDIRMYNVDFGYVKDKIVLHDVSLYAKPGQKIAFVGATGAGKTTITNLINRFYDIADGKIRYDDININTIKKADLRRSLGIVLQDTSLFTGTIMDNIRYGRLDATDEECIAASKLANAHEFISMMEHGYNTVINGDGGALSQGQKQLISIARAACCNAPVMILDEATSSIDTRTEALVQKGTDQLMQGRTVFVIAHRLSTVQNANAIMVLDHGRIIERGTHEDLINLKGTYYQLYTGAFELE